VEVVPVSLRSAFLFAFVFLLLGGALGYRALSLGATPGLVPPASWRAEREGDWWVYTLTVGRWSTTFRERASEEASPPRVAFLPVALPPRSLLLWAAGAGALVGAGLTLLALALLARFSQEET
jgi:hypothetical protein